jgi:glycerol-3-phosphate acyltransferase PlsY
LAAISLPVTVWLRGRPMPLVVMAAVLALFVVVRHRDNIRRLVQGTENRFNKHSAEPSES